MQNVGMKAKPLITQTHINVLPHTSHSLQILGIKEKKNPDRHVICFRKVGLCVAVFTSVKPGKQATGVVNMS